MTEEPQDQKRKPPSAPKSKKLPRKLPDDPISRAVHIMREATGEMPERRKPKA